VLEQERLLLLPDIERLDAFERIVEFQYLPDAVGKLEDEVVCGIALQGLVEKF
jgi:hypothetical protein